MRTEISWFSPPWFIANFSGSSLTGCLKTRIESPDNARNDSKIAVYQAYVKKHWRKPHNTVWRPEAQDFNSRFKSIDFRIDNTVQSNF